jgi:hypothetical protein
MAKHSLVRKCFQIEQKSQNDSAEESNRPFDSTCAGMTAAWLMADRTPILQPLIVRPKELLS